MGSTSGAYCPLRSQSKDILFIICSFCAALILALAALITFGSEERGLVIALRLTGRLQFILFWVAYARGPAETLFGARLALPPGHARQYGLGFVAALLVHLGLILQLCLIGKAPTAGVFIFFGLAALVAYLLAALSIPKLRQAVSPPLLSIITTLGMNYVLYAFWRDFAHPLSGGFTHVVEYLPFTGLILIGVALRLLGYANRLRSWRLRALRDSQRRLSFKSAVADK
jgi:hypothetical protein